MNLMSALRPQPTPVFEFESLSALPCGCVTAAYRAVQWEVSLVSVEAKGPHCILSDHFIGQVLQLGDVSAGPTPYDEDDAG
ncbi:MAG: hypothetical protein KJ066_04680 [Acidobacteria bacterium]|nr:hypothetical protein [Acidobacteriota bacterium]